MLPRIYSIATQMTAKEGHKDQLRRIFEVFGEIHNVYNHTRQMWCWVQFASPETTQKVGLGKVLNRSGADLAQKDSSGQTPMSILSKSRRPTPRARRSPWRWRMKCRAKW